MKYIVCPICEETFCLKNRIKKTICKTCRIDNRIFYKAAGNRRRYNTPEVKKRYRKKHLQNKYLKFKLPNETFNQYIDRIILR